MDWKETPMSIRFVLRMVVGCVFLVAGTVKFLDPQSMKVTLSAFGVPARLLDPASFLLPLSEVVLSMVIMSRRTYKVGLRSGIVFLSMLTVSIIWNLANGRRPRCNCSGGLGDAVIGWQSILRNVALIVLSIFLVREPGKMSWTFRSENLGVPRGILFIIGGQATAIGWLVIKRLHQAGSGDPRLEDQTGLEIGTPIPSLQLIDVDNQLIGLSTVLDDRPSVIYVLSSSCKPCKEVLISVKHITSTDFLVSHRAIVIIPSADVPPSGFREKQGISLPVYKAQNDIYEAFGIAGTPAAFTVSSDGRVASSIAIGVSEISRLVESLNELTSPNPS